MGTYKPDRSGSVYLHLRKGQYPARLIVAKMARSLDAAVEPGDVVVRVRVSVPGTFFDDATPYVSIEFHPEDAVVPPEVRISSEES